MSFSYTIRPVEVDDAEELLHYLKQVGSETDMLLFGKEGLSFTLEQERQFIAQFNAAERNVMLVAIIDEQIAGICSLQANPNMRLRHWGDLAISVLQKYWKKGLAYALMEAVLSFAKETGLEMINLQVRSDNTAAIALYKKFSFKQYGYFKNYFLIEGKHFDACFMNLVLDE